MKTILMGALLCALGVTFGAFGAHAVADTLTSAQKSWWDTATDYVWYHGIAFLALSSHGQQLEISKAFEISSCCPWDESARNAIP